MYKYIHQHLVTVASSTGETV